MDKVGKYLFMSEPFHCDFSKRLFMGHLGNHMLNAADFHSSERGFGMTYLNPIHKTWVLSRLAIEMEEMPEQYTRFYVETWVESAMRYFTNRNFRVVGEDGTIYGYGRSVWAMIDTGTRQPQDIMAVRDGEIVNWIETEKECPMEKGSRVRMSGNAELVRTIDTHYNDVDVNGHINSVKYIEHVLDLFSLDNYRENRIGRFEIAYVAESYYGDRLSFFREETADGEYCVRIVKTNPENLKEVEVCRSKIVFVKK
ncbi:acyl-[acyl-carrier-protein] thioesterase [Xylanibacter muris]|uniref:Acyl-[acyl-carrier-protein] thioesterase n=1 Tax=Xylanibacter muris TaxID=2736290 RepID=A0ABX2AN69_9BACT|nr:acyl-ACP thioesterase domain-containing protein [Xylanibacter muris]NPD92383.1 acyl-[acyl-carrier-protein] thioesterase [Xylanibacter muris]